MCIDFCIIISSHLHQITLQNGRDILDSDKKKCGIYEHYKDAFFSHTWHM